MPQVINTALIENQEKLLAEARNQVARNAFDMKTCLDNNKMMDALKFASNMLGELRTSLLSPKSYYDLYVGISDELQHLEQFLLDEFQKGNKMSDLYELVQYAGNIVPRLYLLVTVGMVYIKSSEGSRKDILKDLVEMCRGVQHPLRGLFLRNYLLQCSRNQLPDTEGSGGKDGSVEDSIQFILQNFAEMNKLWVRMQHQGHTKDKDKREKERLELRILVGTNLVRLSQLEAIDAAVYQKSVLPNLLEQVIKCKDAIAQQYLMECVIQVFPDELHLQTLNLLLPACADLLETVNVKEIIIALIDRLASYAHRADSGGIPSDIKLFEIFSQEVAIVIQSRVEIPLDDVVALYTSLMNLALKCYASRIDYVDKCLCSCMDSFKKKLSSLVEGNSSTGREFQRLMKVPVDLYEDTLTVLKLENYSKAMELFDYNGRKNLALHLVQSIVDKACVISSTEQAEVLFGLLSPLIKDQTDQPKEEPDQEDFSEEQWLMGRLVNLLQADTPDQQFLMLNTARKHFGTGGDSRIKHTLPSVVFAACKLVMAYRSIKDEDERWQMKCERILKFSRETIMVLMKVKPELSMKLFLQAAIVADQVGVETFVYEFVTQALSIYEEDIADSRAKEAAITLMIGSFEQMRSLGQENQENLCTKCAQESSRLLKKPGQCRGVALSAHLFWTGKVCDENGEVTERRDGKRVMECLKKSGRIAKQCMDKQVEVQLLVEVLDSYLLFHEKGNQHITTEFVKQVLSKVKEELGSIEEEEAMKKHFDNTLAHIQAAGNGATYKDVLA